jgi:hypothetical protein
MPWGEPGSGTLVPGAGEVGDITDFRDEHRRPGRADAGDGVDWAVAGVGGQPRGDPSGAQVPVRGKLAR